MAKIPFSIEITEDEEGNAIVVAVEDPNASGDSLARQLFDAAMGAINEEQSAEMSCGMGGHELQ